MLITQVSEKGDRTIVLLQGLQGIPIDAIGHAQQIECFGHALGVMEPFKESKRFLMCLQTLFGATGIDQPVADAVEATSMKFRIGEHLREIK